MWWKNWMASAIVHHRRSFDASEPRPQEPRARQHHQRVAVVQRLRLDEPGKEVTQRAARFGHGPAERVDLERLQQVLGPVRQHDDHEHPQGGFMPLGIQPIDERR